LETMSIKALAAKVLERNKQRNRLETQSFLANKMQQNIQTIRKPRTEIQAQQAKIVNGEFICLLPVTDMAKTIVNLTENDLPLQKKLLIRHCQQYNPVTHFWNLREMWDERAAILEFEAGFSREEAETKAAEMYHLLAFMDELREPQQ